MGWKTTAGLLFAILIGISAVFILKRSSTIAIRTAQPKVELTEASSAACKATAAEEGCPKGCCRVLVLQVPSPTRKLSASLRLNAIDMSWDQSKGILHDVLMTRANRTVFVKTDPDLAPDRKAQLYELIRRTCAERICVIDPKIHRNGSRLSPAWRAVLESPLRTSRIV